MMPSALTETIIQNSNIFFFISKKKIQTKHIKQKFLLQNIKSKTRIHCMAIISTEHLKHLETKFLLLFAVNTNYIICDCVRQGQFQIHFNHNNT